MNAGLRNRLAVAFGAAGVLAAVLTTATTPALGVGASTSPVRILSVQKVGPVNLGSPFQTLLSLRLPAGHWLFLAQLIANNNGTNSVAVVDADCSISKGTKALNFGVLSGPTDNPGGGAGGIVSVNTTARLRSTATITFRCNGVTGTTAANMVLSAVG